MTNDNRFSDFAFIVGIDIAKNVFQIYSLNTDTGERCNVPVKREHLLERFANCGRCIIGMEACGSSQYWARKLQSLGHEVTLMDGKLVKPFVMHNKSDHADAEGIFHALMQGVRPVAVKSETERDIQTLLRMRRHQRKLHNSCESKTACPTVGDVFHDETRFGFSRMRLL